jgi:hypothetical protein
MIFEKAGYEFNGFKLGQKVYIPESQEEGTIVGFDHVDTKFIAVRIGTGMFHCEDTEDWADTPNLVFLKNEWHFDWLQADSLQVVEQSDEQSAANNHLTLKKIQGFTPDQWFVMIESQDTSLIPRGNFKWNYGDVTIVSEATPDIFVDSEDPDHVYFYVRGTAPQQDTDPMIVYERELDLIEEALFILNKELSNYYYYINTQFELTKALTSNSESAQHKAAGNYFSTEYEGLAALARIKRALHKSE